MKENKTFLNEKFITRWVSGKITKEEKDEFEQWINKNTQQKAYFDLIQNIWDNTGKIELMEGDSEEKRWNRISGKLDFKETNVFKMHIRKIVGIAATFILAVCIYFLQFYQGQIEVITPIGKHQVMYLPDSSKVTLNAESIVRYDKNEWNRVREVALEGEAFFEVKPGKQFNVKSNFVTTTVLGTSFNIYSRNNKTEVACITGKVSVTTGRNESLEVVLTPGFASEVMGNNFPTQPFEFNINQKISWISGEFYFSSKPLYEAFKEIGRQYGYPVILQKNIDQQLFTGLIKDTDINKALEVVCLSAGLKYSFSADSTILIF